MAEAVSYIYNLGPNGAVVMEEEMWEGDTNPSIVRIAVHWHSDVL